MARKSSNTTPATDAEIRAAFRNGDFKAPDAMLPALQGGRYTKTGGYVASESGLVRGRLSQAVRDLFTAETGRPARGEFAPGERRTVSTKEVEIPMRSPKTGRAIKPKVVNLAEAKRLAGVEGKKGRLSNAEISAVAVALGSAPLTD